MMLCSCDIRATAEELSLMESSSTTTKPGPAGFLGAGSCPRMASRACDSTTASPSSSACQVVSLIFATLLAFLFRNRESNGSSRSHNTSETQWTSKHLVANEVPRCQCFSVTEKGDAFRKCRSLPMRTMRTHHRKRVKISTNNSAQLPPITEVLLCYSHNSLGTLVLRVLDTKFARYAAETASSSLPVPAHAHPELSSALSCGTPTCDTIQLTAAACRGHSLSAVKRSL